MKALLQAWNKGHQRVLQTDSLLAAKWLNTNVEYPIEFSNLVLDYRWLLNKEWEARMEGGQQLCRYTGKLGSF